jgi:type I restriction enzyme S subunit
VLRPRLPIPTILAYLVARSDEFRTFAIQQMTGSSGRQRVPAETLTRYHLAAPLPDSAVFTAFAGVIDPLFNRIRSAMEECRTLSGLRDALLPRLISGELRVPDAERIVARCD